LDSYYYGQSTNGNYDFIGSNGSIYNGNNSREPFIRLAHEMGHIEDIWKETINNTPWVTLPDGWDSDSQFRKYAMYVENQVRAEHGKALKTHYISAIESTRVLEKVGRHHYSRFYTKPSFISNFNIGEPFMQLINLNIRYK